MRAWAGAVAAAAVALASCTGGDGAAGPLPSTTSAAPTTTTPPPTSTAPSSTVTDPPGSVTLEVRGLTLPAGAGLRALVRAASPRVTVRRQGAGGPLSVCPVADATTPAGPGGCADLGAARDVDLGTAPGVEVRAAGAGVTVEEVTVTYLPLDRSTTLVTPARPPGSCAATPCRATFSVTPPRPGPFTLAGRAGGGRPRLSLQSVPASGAPPRLLASAEGGAALSVTATLEPSAQAVLHYQEQVDGAVAALTMEILWP